MSYSRSKYQRQAFFAGLVPYYGRFLSAKDSTRQMDDYMRNRQLNWSDIKYPTKTVGWAGYSGYGSLARDSLNYVSKNVGKLYR